MGQVMRWLDKSVADIRPHERSYIEVRVYQPEGAGYYFTGHHQAIRWYLKDSPDADHFGRADVDDVRAAIDAGAKIQVCGSRGISYGVWDGLDEFAREVGL